MASMRTLMLSVAIGYLLLAVRGLESRRHLKHSTRITNKGSYLKRGDDRFPFNQTVEIALDGINKCTGTVIEKGTILSIKHCFPYEGKTSVSYGHLKSDGEKSYSCKEICHHRELDISISHCDIPGDFKEMCFAKDLPRDVSTYKRIGFGVTNKLPSKAVLTYEDSLRIVECKDNGSDFCYESPRTAVATLVDLGGPILDDRNCLVGLIGAFVDYDKIEIVAPQVEKATSLVGRKYGNMPKEDFVCAKLD